MNYKEKIKSLHHESCFYDINVNEDDFRLDLFDRNKNFLLRIICNPEREDVAKKIYNVLRYYNFCECRSIDTLEKLKELSREHDYAIKWNDNGIIFVKYFFDGTMKKYTKEEIEKRYHVKIDLNKEVML
jgi:hypothetical protein